jgi:hypothetical protein
VAQRQSTSDTNLTNVTYEMNHVEGYPPWHGGSAVRLGGALTIFDHDKLG